jgi:hypothetical protein
MELWRLLNESAGAGGGEVVPLRFEEALARISVAKPVMMLPAARESVRSSVYG